jgi:transposase
MVWGCISTFGFHDLILLDGRLDSVGYIGILENTLTPIMQSYFHNEPFIFQQDRAAVHTAQVVYEFFEDHNIPVLEWPPHSPDLNIIEHAWHYIKQRIREMKIATSSEELWSNIQLALVHIPYVGPTNNQ